MKTIFIILSIIGVFVFAYFFPKGIKIFGIPAEIFFGKEKQDDDMK